MEKKNKKTLLLSGLSVVILILLDQFTKYLAVIFLKDKPAIPIIKDVFELKYLENTSAAFGMDPISLLHNILQFDIFNENPQLYLNVRMGFFYILTIAMIFMFIWLFLKIPNTKRFIFVDWILIFISAGAIGNLIDRISQQFVVDFLYFKLIDFPIFNIADCYVVIATILFALLILFYYKDEELSFLTFEKKEQEN